MISKISELSTKQKLGLSIVSFIILYGASFAITIGVLSYAGSQLTESLSPASRLKDKTSDTIFGDNPCPLSGVGYSDELKNNWEKRRPLGVMIENHVDARPQQGLSKADIIYEAVAEGGITRFLAVYLCLDAGDLAPVRSARTYYLDWISEYDALYAHVGGANTPGTANALGQIRQYKIKDLDQFGLGFPTYWRSSDKFAPHNVHSTTEKLYEAGSKRGWTNVDEKGVAWNEKFQSWQFKDDAVSDLRPASASAKVNFWSNFGAYSVDWKYDSAKNKYLRFHAETPHTDPLTNEQLTASNVVIQFLQESRANDGYPGNVHILYKTIGSGNAVILQDGKAIEATWRKPDRTARTKYFDSTGKEIQFNKGTVWIQTVPVGAQIDY